MLGLTLPGLTILKRLSVVAILLAPAGTASLVKIQVTERTDVLGGRSMGSAGPYERILARAFFEVDPKLPANRAIRDIDLAPRNENGKVEFSADLYILKPIDSAKGNGTVLFDVPNRGRKLALAAFNLAAASNDPRTPAELGDNLLFERGFTVAWLGWQADIPDEPGLVRLFAPYAAANGAPLTGLLRAEYIPDKKQNSFSLGDRTMMAYPVIDPADPSSQLTVRDTPRGERTVIPRAKWQFAREEFGGTVPDTRSVYMAEGFQPGRIYEVVYRSQNPIVSGLGLAGVRDLISFLKYGAANTLLGDQRRYIKHAVAFGSSQSGRFLRTLLYYGFNADEKDRKVFDGIWSNVAGAGRGSFNHRFAQPSRDGHPFMNVFYPTDLFPFTDLEQTDSETGAAGGILVPAMKANVVPRIFYTNGSYEYWGRAASLIHTTLDGRQDAPLAPGTRIYLNAGTQHGANSPSRRANTRHYSNPNDFRWAMRALLAAMHAWVKEGKEPPASRYPRISSDQLVPVSALAFPKIPGVGIPTRLQHAYRMDYGPEFENKGIVSLQPPKVGKAFPVLVPQVDSDGNETSGIRLPEVAVPLATYTGWNLRDPKAGAPMELSNMIGSFLPFAKTKAERLKTKDPRPSIEERYKSREDFLEKTAAAAKQLVEGGYLLPSDVEPVVARSAKLWDRYAAGR